MRKNFQANYFENKNSENNLKATFHEKKQKKNLKAIFF